MPTRKPSKFKPSRGIEQRYARALAGVAREVGRIVGQYKTYTAERAAEVKATLHRYAELITPWAREVAANTAAAVNTASEARWRQNAQALSAGLKAELRAAPVGGELRRFHRENVDLITSLPRHAGERVQRITVQSLGNAERYGELQQSIQRTGEVTKARAELIARTETAKTASALTQVRAEAVGSNGYIWRTAEDGDVRPEHRRLEGKVFQWDNPPVAGPNGERYNAGQGPNCRCYPEPIFEE